MAPMKHVPGIVIAVALVVTGCGKDDKKAGGEGGGSVATSGSAAAPGSAASGRTPIDKARAEALSKLDVAGFTRTRGEARGRTAVLVYLGEPSTGGFSAEVLANVGPCEMCDMKMEREHFDRMLSAAHKANPALRFESGELDLGGGVMGTYGYWESFVKEGGSTSARHKLWVSANDKVNTVTLDISPKHKDGFKMPASIEELKAEMTKDEMLATAQWLVTGLGVFPEQPK
jgi:hypothetical protein